MSRFPATSPGRWALVLGAFFTIVCARQASAQDKAKDEAKGESAPREENPEYRFDFYLFGGGHFFTQVHALGRSVGVVRRDLGCKRLVHAHTWRRALGNHVGSSVGG